MTEDTKQKLSPPSRAAAGSEWRWRIVNGATQKWVSRHRSWEGANLRLTKLHRHAPVGLYFMEKIPNTQAQTPPI